jgi:hypothetical protein
MKHLVSFCAEFCRGLFLKIGIGQNEIGLQRIDKAVLGVIEIAHDLHSPGSSIIQYAPGEIAEARAANDIFCRIKRVNDFRQSRGEAYDAMLSVCDAKRKQECITVSFQILWRSCAISDHDLPVEYASKPHRTASSVAVFPHRQEMTTPTHWY